MADPHVHYRRAEELLTEGERVVSRISTHATHRAAILSAGKLSISDRAKVDELTVKMDELGKKARGIWAQAAVHATLATVSKEIW